MKSHYSDLFCNKVGQSVGRYVNSLPGSYLNKRYKYDALSTVMLNVASICIHKTVLEFHVREGVQIMLRFENQSILPPHTDY